MASNFDRLMKAMEHERARSMRSVPLAKRLSDLLREEKPSFVSKDGIILEVQRADLLKVVDLIHEEEIARVILPLFLKTTPSMGRGLYRLLGVDTGSEMERLQTKIAFGLLGTEPRSYLHSYEVRRMKRELPSLVYVFY